MMQKAELTHLRSGLVPIITGVEGSVEKGWKRVSRTMDILSSWHHLFLYPAYWLCSVECVLLQ